MTRGTSSLIEWIRLPGDLLFIVGGVVPFLYATVLGLGRRGPKGAVSEGEHALFTDVTGRDGTGARSPADGRRGDRWGSRRS